ncbi:MAG: response regulator [Lachnospiraceae bacterium]|nr:response regulator [Lachnospiraceae bacterium]
MYAYVLSIKGQIFCMLVLLYIAGIYFSVKRRRTSGHRLFSAMLTLSIVYMAFDMITVYTINHVQEIPIVLNHFCHIVFMSSMIAVLFVFYLYLRFLAFGRVGFKLYHAIPLVIGVLASTFLPFEYEETAYGNYSWGAFAMIAFVSAYFYFIIGTVLLIRFRKKMDSKSFFAIFVSNIVVLGTAILQGKYPTLLISGISLTLVDLALFYTVESPDAILIESLARERERADSANRAKTLFLAQMSHDIRTPINAMLGMNEMILRETDNDDIAEYSRDIQTAGKSLLSLINTILDFSKIEDGKMELVIVQYDLAAFVKNIVLSMQSRARSRGLEFIVNVDENLPAALFGDDVRLNKVISNLLTNAIKYTEKGSVRLDFIKVSENDKNVTMRVVVADTGIGIKKEELDTLFNEFTRLDEERNRNIEGVGLGMSIVRHLLEMMGTKLEVESTYGVGSTFSFNVIQRIADATPVGDYTQRIVISDTDLSLEDEFEAPGARVLIVDDNPMNLKVAKKLLSIFGIEPDLANSGAECIEMVKKKDYQLIGLDHMMPEMNGVETLEKMRQEKLLSEDTRVIAMTANAVAGAKEMYLKAGFDDYVSKPIEVDAMKEKLISFLPADILIKKKTEEKEKEELEVLTFEPDIDPDAEILTFEPEDEEASAPDSEDLLEKLASIGIDGSAGLRYCADDMSLYTEILQDFVAAQEEKAASLEKCLSDKNFEDYRIQIHALKNNLRTVGLAELGEKAYELEQAAANEDIPFIEVNHGSFLEEYKARTKSMKDVMA